MPILKSIQSAMLLISFMTFPTLVQATDISSDYEEVSYDDLVNELKQRKQTITRAETSSFDEVRLHAGIGYTNSFTNISANNQNYNRHATGIQLHIGMDLFSENWYSEGVFKNYGVTSYGTEEMTLREVDLKLGYTNKLDSLWNYSISSGLSNRFLHFSDSIRSVDLDNTTPSLIIATGFSAQVHKNFSIGAELTSNMPIVNRTADKNSFDFAFRLTTSL